MKNDPLFKHIKSANVPKSNTFKAQLKEHLMERAEKKYARSLSPLMWRPRLFRYALAFGMLAVIVTQVFFPRDGQNSSLQLFIEQANAATEGHEEDIYHATIVMESESNYEGLGWVTDSTTEKELWISPKGELRESIQWTNLNGPYENGEFEETKDETLDIMTFDEWGNAMIYTQLEKTGTELREIDGEMVEQSIYNVHPEKQFSSEVLSKNFENQIACVNTEKNEDFTGYSWVRLRENDPTFIEVMGTARPYDPKYSLVQKLDDAAEGKMSSEEIIEFFEEIQDEPNIQYELKKVDGRLQHVIQVNYADFDIISSNSKEGLQDFQREDRIATLYFDDETFHLTQMTSENSFNGVVSSRGTLTVTSWEYLDYESNQSLFEPTDEFIAIQLTDRFESDISQFEAGCYDHEYNKLSDSEADEWINKAEALMDENSLNLWSNPLKMAIGYYRLSGEDEIKGEVLEQAPIEEIVEEIAEE